MRLWDLAVRLLGPKPKKKTSKKSAFCIYVTGVTKGSCVGLETEVDRACK